MYAVYFDAFQGLKNHAVTMFEVGKLTDESMDSFLVELGKVSTMYTVHYVCSLAVPLFSLYSLYC